MKAIGLDLGSTLGWSTYDDSKLPESPIESGVMIFQNKSGMHPGQRYSEYNSFIVNMIAEFDPDFICYEKVESHTSKVGNRTTFNVKAAHLYGFFKNALIGACADYGIDCVGLPVGAIKKFATGKGNAKKQVMLKAAQRAFRHKILADDNEADSLWILTFGIVERTGQYIVSDGAGQDQGVMI